MPNKSSYRKNPRMTKILIILGVLLLAVAVIAFKNQPQPQPEKMITVRDLPEALLDSALNSGKPTLAFFHSNNCEQCIIMIENVDQVYPEFRNSVELIDIDVYNPLNNSLLDRVKLQYIPTLIFYDNKGQSKTFVGVMDNQMLHDWFTEIAETE